MIQSSVDAILAKSAQTFDSLRIRNYRLFFFGQMVSMMGSWMQTVALGWLTLEVTGSGTQLGTITALQFLPILLFGPWGGLFVDRRDTRRVLIMSQWAYCATAFVMSGILFFGSVDTWMLYAFALILGMIRVFDNPGRQTFVSELVGAALLKNAVTLNSMVNNLGRAVGPMIAGALIATTSNAFCFFFNGVTYLFVLYMLYRMRAEELFETKIATREKGQIMEGLRYVATSPRILHTLIAMSIVGIFVYEWQVSLPLLAQETFSGTAATYAALMSAFGLGSVAGGLYAASRKTATIRNIIANMVLMGLALTVCSFTITLAQATVALFFVGIFSINVITQANTLIQLETLPEMRGRVMALWSMAMIGSTPIGGPIVGALAEFAGARWGIGIAAIAAFGGGAYLHYARRYLRAAAVRQ